MKSSKPKKGPASNKEKTKSTSKEKPPRVITAQGWKNYLKRKYFSKK